MRYENLIFRTGFQQFPKRHHRHEKKTVLKKLFFYSGDKKMVVWKRKFLRAEKKFLLFHAELDHEFNKGVFELDSDST